MLAHGLVRRDQRTAEPGLAQPHGIAGATLTLSRSPERILEAVRAMIGDHGPDLLLL